MSKDKVSVPPWTLRILSGRNKGARVELAEPITVGHAFSNTVVIRDSAASGFKARLTPQAEYTQLDMLEGQIEVLGRVLTAPSSTLLPPYVPVLIGQSAVAVGFADEAGWKQALRLLDVRVQPADGPAPVPAAEPTERSVWLRPSVVFALLATFALPAAAFWWLQQPPPPLTPLQQIERARMALAAEFPRLTFTSTEGCPVTIGGWLVSDADRVKLDRALAEAGIKACVVTRSNDQIALAVSDVYRTNGMTTRVTPLGDGAVQVQIAEFDSARAKKVRDMALRDVPGLTRIDLQAGVTELAPLNSVFPGGKSPTRVTAVIEGNPGYMVTEDGTRYFEGAQLPSGHRLVAIRGSSVQIEKDGETSTVVF